MKLKLSQIVNSIESLNVLVDTKFPAKVSYRLKRIVDKVNPILKTYNEKRDELITEYGTKDEVSGNMSVTDPEKIKLFMEKLNEILEVEEEVDITPIPSEFLGDTEVEAKHIVDFVFTD